jgi:transketolase
MSTGSLGQGISAACGMALGLRHKGYSSRVFCLMGDGELEEGEAWEAFMFAGYRKLDNLIVIVDNNDLQIDGHLDEVCSPYPLAPKFEAFNFNVLTVDGNDMAAVADVFEKAKGLSGKPVAIIAKTVKGKGVSFMENDASWHGKAPNDEEFKVAMQDLERLGEKIG